MALTGETDYNMLLDAIPRKLKLWSRSAERIVYLIVYLHSALGLTASRTTTYHQVSQVAVCVV